MHLVHQPLTTCDESLPEVAIPADRRQLARRLWRASADDGTEFGFELETPLRHGDVVWQGPDARYLVRQQPEPVLEIALAGTPDAAAVVGWAVGNLHFAIQAAFGRLLAPDDSGLCQALDRLGISYRRSVEIFQPHRFAGALVGHGHGHEHHHH